MFIILNNVHQNFKLHLLQELLQKDSVAILYLESSLQSRSNGLSHSHANILFVEIEKFSFLIVQEFVRLFVGCENKEFILVIDNFTIFDFYAGRVRDYCYQVFFECVAELGMIVIAFDYYYSNRANRANRAEFLFVGFQECYVLDGNADGDGESKNESNSERNSGNLFIYDKKKCDDKNLYYLIKSEKFLNSKYVYFMCELTIAQRQLVESKRRVIFVGHSKFAMFLLKLRIKIYQMIDEWFFN
ncbi:MAG: hypothetical protein HQK49_03550 [Oligoflexia bacterium]|nr:hypothetical protein [Oligoflexia bacterium]